MAICARTPLKKGQGMKMSMKRIAEPMMDMSDKA